MCIRFRSAFFDCPRGVFRCESKTMYDRVQGGHNGEWNVNNTTLHSGIVTPRKRKLAKDFLPPYLTNQFF